MVVDGLSGYGLSVFSYLSMVERCPERNKIKRCGFTISGVHPIDELTLERFNETVRDSEKEVNRKQFHC